MARSVWMLGVWQRFECRQDCLTKTPIVLFLDIDDCLLLCEKLTQLLIGATQQAKALVGLVMPSEHVVEEQIRIIPDEVRSAEGNRLHTIIQLVFKVLCAEESPPPVLRYLVVISTSSFVRWEYSTCTAIQKTTPSSGRRRRAASDAPCPPWREGSTKDPRCRQAALRNPNTWKSTNTCLLHISLNSTTVRKGAQSTASGSWDMVDCCVVSDSIDCRFD